MAEWKQVLRETHRRSLWQVAGVYALISWGVLQVVLALYEALGLPKWVPPVTVALLAIGFPVVLATAYVTKRLPKPAELIGRDDYDPTLHPNLEDDRRAPELQGVQRFLTWRHAVIAGVGAFILLASGTTGFVALERRGTLVAQGLVDAESPVVLADFANTSRDSTLGSVITEALRVDLQQSNVVQLAQAADIESALQRMQRTPAQGLPANVARELAEREGMRAVITGQVSALGAGFVITSTVISADSGRTLASFRAQARDSTELISAVNDLSKQVRQKIGESVRAVRNSMPLAQATTSSLPALRKYTEGIIAERETGDHLRGVDLMKEAVAIDSTFGDAWRAIGVYLSNIGVRPAERDAALKRAYELRDRLPERTRYVAKALYMEIVVAQIDSAIDAYRQVLAIDSTDYSALNNLAILLMDEHRYQEAEVMLTRATRLDTTEMTGWTNLTIVQFYEGKKAEAARTVAAARAALPHNYRIQALELNVAGNDDHWDRIDSMATVIAATYPANKGAQLDLLKWRMSAAQGLGHLEKALAIGAQLRQRQEEMHFPGLALLTAASMAETRYLAGDTRGAIQEMDAAVRAHPLSAFPAGNSPADVVALTYYRIGQADRARLIIDERRKALGSADEFDRYGRAVMDAGRGKAAAAAAAEVIRSRLDSIQCSTCRLLELGHAYEAAGANDSARVTYERYLSGPIPSRLNAQALSRADVLIRLAVLYEQAGDTAHAIARYSEFVQLWSGADQALQPRVTAAKNRILALQAKG